MYTTARSACKECGTGILACFNGPRAPRPDESWWGSSIVGQVVNLQADCQSACIARTAPPRVGATFESVFLFISAVNQFDLNVGAKRRQVNGPDWLSSEGLCSIALAIQGDLPP